MTTTDWQDPISKIKSTTSKFASTMNFLKTQPQQSSQASVQSRLRPSFSASAPPTPPKSPDEELPRLSFSLGSRRNPITAPSTPSVLTPHAEEYESYPLHPPSSSSSSSSTAYSSFPTTPHAEKLSPNFAQADVSTPAPAQAIGQLYVNVIEARDITISDPGRALPYCLVEFEKNQLTTSDPSRHNEDPNGIPIPGARARSSPASSSRRELAKLAASPTWRHEATFDVTRRDGEITISVYDRGVVSTTGEEAFLGMVTIRPSLIHNHRAESWFRLKGRGGIDPEGGVSGDIRVVVVYTALEIRKQLHPSDFMMQRLVGRGSFGKVFQVKKIDTGRTYAMKVLSKRDLVERKEVTHTLAERNVLIRADASPFIVGLKFSFQTPEKLYLVMDFVSGGELFWHLQREKMFSEERARFYCAELVLALDHLHKFDVVYRDLKPENILLDSTGHVALTDFGLCKEDVGPDKVATTFCGTSEYLAPEVLLSKGYNRSVDWWSLGILLYECMTGWPPFYSEDVTELYDKILNGKIRWPASMSRDARQLITALLERDPTKRLGSSAEDAAEIKRHPFFASIAWDKLSKKQVPPPFKPPSAAEIAAVGRVGGVGIEDWEGISSEGMIVGSGVSQKWKLAKQQEVVVGSLDGTWQQQFGGFSFFRDDASLTSMMSRRTAGSVDSWVE